MSRPCRRHRTQTPTSVLDGAIHDYHHRVTDVVQTESSMPKKTIDLDTPFKKGEKVMMARTHRNIPDGAQGKVKLINGLETLEGMDPWIRYWIRFDDHGLVGHVSHEDLVRPYQFDEWLEREKEREEAELAAQKAEAEGAEAAPAEVGGGDGGIASQIPAQLLERSKAAKARLLGG